MRVAKPRRPRGRTGTSWWHPAGGRWFTIAAVVCILAAALGSGWLELLFPAGLILTTVAFFKGDKLGIYLVLALSVVLRVAMVILAPQKYG